MFVFLIFLCYYVKEGSDNVYLINIKDLAASIVKEAITNGGNTLIIVLMIIVIVGLFLYSVFSKKNR